MKGTNYHTKYAQFLLITILIVAAILRFKEINQPYIDATSWREASTAMMADNFYHTNWNILYPEISWDGPGPSYNGREFQTVSYITALLYTILGQHDWVGRSVVVLFGLWGIFALYQLVLRVWDCDHALASAAVMAILPGSIYIDRTFIPDPAMVALLTTSCWFLVAYYQTEKQYYLWLASLTGMLGFSTKIPGLIVGFPMLYATWKTLSRRRELGRREKPILIATAITLIPVIAYYLWARHLALNYPPYHFAGNDSGNWLWNASLIDWWNQKFGLSKTFKIFESWLWSYPFMALISIGFLASHFQPFFKSQGIWQTSDSEMGNSHHIPWLFHWWMYGVMVYYLLGMGHLTGNPYNFHLINPPAAAFGGHAIVALATWIRTQLGKSAAIAIITTLLIIIGGYGQHKLQPMYHPHGEEGYALGIALREISQPHDLVTTITKDIGNPVAIYYSQRRGWSFFPGDTWSVETYDQQQISQFKKLRTQGVKWFGIVNDQYLKIEENNSTFLNYIKRNCELIRESNKWVIYRIIPLK